MGKSPSVRCDLQVSQLFKNHYWKAREQYDKQLHILQDPEHLLASWHGKNIMHVHKVNST